MKHYLIFAGTTEGRQLTEFLLERPVQLTVCLATEYGKLLMPEHDRLTLLCRRLSAEEMLRLMSSTSYDCVFDATHPYAILVSENIRTAAAKAGLPYYRILRPEEPLLNCPDMVCVDSMEAAVDYLSGTVGNILAATGSKELAKLCALADYQERVYARILPNPEMTAASYALGFRGRHLICAQGPFSVEFNTALIHQYNISYLLTKSSGRSGGFPEKAESALQTGTTLVIIGRPQEKTAGYTLEQIYAQFA